MDVAAIQMVDLKGSDVAAKEVLPYSDYFLVCLYWYKSPRTDVAGAQEAARAERREAGLNRILAIGDWLDEQARPVYLLY